jgi:hypothetical protein
MSLVFTPESVGFFDKVTLDAEGRISGVVPCTPQMPDDVFDKWLVCVVSGRPGSYPTSVKFEPPAEYGEMSMLPGGNLILEAGKSIALCNLLTQRGLIPGI